ncbi:MAG: DUF5615 family PIN-like protein [Phycisphaerales bacterium]|nr:DUF5615 family PIN-like protein [Phycisphaerales bacterium]
MKLPADLHISPRTVAFLRKLGHDVVRVADIMDPRSTDAAIIARARGEGRTILTQNLDFSRIIAVSGQSSPSLVLLRLGSTRVEFVNAMLQRVLPQITQAVEIGSIVTVSDRRIRTRRLPLDLEEDRQRPRGSEGVQAMKQTRPEVRSGSGGCVSTS